MQSLKSMDNSNMPKLSKKAIHSRRTDGRTYPNYRKASLLKRVGTRAIYNCTHGGGNPVPTSIGSLNTSNTVGNIDTAKSLQKNKK